MLKFKRSSVGNMVVPSEDPWKLLILQDWNKLLIHSCLLPAFRINQDMEHVANTQHCLPLHVEGCGLYVGCTTDSLAD